jgi:hypothetical protein
MATLPKIVYNFNENSTTTIRDYSENGNDGTGTGLTLSASAIVGYDCTLGATDNIAMGNITDLNGVSAFSIHLKMIIPSLGATGTLKVFSKSGVIDCTYDKASTTLSCTITDNIGGTFTVSDVITNGTYDIDIVMGSNVLTLYKDGTSVDSDNTLTNPLAGTANTMTIGSGGGTNSADFSLNEFKLYDAAVSTDNIAAFIAEPNGISSDSGINGEFNVGDIIGADLLGDPAASKFAIVSYVDGTSGFRFLPLSDNIAGGQIFRRIGHLWDTTRQWALKIDDTPEICFYDGVSQSSDAFGSSKKTFCINKEGIIKTSSTKTANYTITSSDQRIYVDSSGGAFTITLEASPTTDREIEIIDKTGSCASFNVTVAGNGNNIIGSANYVMSTDYEGLRLIFNGTNWNLN